LSGSHGSGELIWTNAFLDLFAARDFFLPVGSVRECAAKAFFYFVPGILLGFRLTKLSQ
jgi:hypothetical protein